MAKLLTASVTASLPTVDQRFGGAKSAKITVEIELISSGDFQYWIENPIKLQQVLQGFYLEQVIDFL